MVIVKKYILKQDFRGLPLPDDLKLVEEELPPIKENEFLAQAIYLSVDPYLPTCVPSDSSKIGQTLSGRQIAKIIASKVKNFSVGKYVIANFPWQTYTIYNTTKAKEDPYNIHPKILPNFEDLPLSLGLGMLGLTGQSAYFGFLELCQPKEGETVVVTRAAGEVGSHVGQIAKIKGCHVIGFVKDDNQGKHITKDLGFDQYVNTQKINYIKKLEEYTKKGIDCYFDSVGGEISSIVMSMMNEVGRISVSPSITFFNEELCHLPRATVIQPYLCSKQLKMQGFQVYSFDKRSAESFKQNFKWIKEGKLKYHESVTEGFENMFVAFINMLRGDSINTAVIKV